MRIQNQNRVMKGYQLTDNAAGCDGLAAARHCQNGEAAGDKAWSGESHVHLASRNERTDVYFIWLN